MFENIDEILHFLKKDEELSLDGEIWKDIKTFPAHEISNLGRVKVKFNNFILLDKRNEKYPYVSLTREGKNINISTHLLVASTFLDNPENLPIVHHIDEDKSNFRSDNLKYVSYEEHGKLHAYSKTKDFQKKKKEQLRKIMISSL